MLFQQIHLILQQDTTRQSEEMQDNLAMQMEKKEHNIRLRRPPDLYTAHVAAAYPPALQAGGYAPMRCRHDCSALSGPQPAGAGCQPVGGAQRLYRTCKLFSVGSS
jgi:hypothetical protein